MRKIMLCILSLGVLAPQNRGASAEALTHPHSWLSESDTERETKLNIKDEQRHLAELKKLLAMPQYQDKTSFDTQKLLSDIKESHQIIKRSKEYLITLMYPNRSIESLMQEAQQNCLAPVELDLHRNGYFHIPRLVKP
ncbi:MAG: hypothetical protein Q8Q56_05645 [Alphaproteobacteria bacterium]|nr:hypothetical protein [Alphaproteobacteria bacterium]